MFNKEQIGISLRITETQTNGKKKTPKKKIIIFIKKIIVLFAFAMEIMNNVIYDIYACTINISARFIPNNI